ncbi:hypothetical protein A4X13_0g1126 [Tilletia indica]|uniref:Uncharacterized protein n=1 Tax=Tilletia indica TaxID=43049 RepID=A0A177TXF5_9BASI|nr:hypothetical protein A4X13_0g1126 [Tilletia indica]
MTSARSLATPSTQSFPFSRLPLELQAQVLLHCDYFTLKRIQRVCKSFKTLLDGAMFDKALFRPTLTPLSNDELVALAQESGTSPDSALSVHPAIQASRWCVRDLAEGIFLYDDAPEEYVKYFRLNTLAARNESATYPAVHSMKVVVRRYGARDENDVLIHEDSEAVKHEYSGAGVRGPITMAELALALFKLEYEWKALVLGWDEIEISSLLPFPDGFDEVSAKLLPDGSVVVTQEIFDYTMDD